MHDDLGAGFNKARGDAAADIATGPGYENRFARQVKYVAVHAMSRQLNCAIVHELGRNEKPERYTSERCWISEILNDLRWPEFSIARCRVEPGVPTELHALAVHEGYVIERARAALGHLVKIEVEVDTLDQFEQAIAAGATAVLLDNMNVGQLTEAVRINAGRVKLEASGNVDIDTVAAIAATGVDYISTSKITMAARPLDIGLDIEITI